MAAIATMPDPQLGEVMSPTQATMALDCSAKWYARYALGLPDPKTSNLSLGIAVHDAIASNFRIKEETGADLPIEDVLTEFDAAWATVEPETAFRDAENPEGIGQAGRQLVELYMREAAPKIQPLAVELAVEGLIGGVRVQGKIDLIDQNRRVREIKTAARKPSGISMNHAFQMATYVQLVPGPHPTIAVDTLVKTKTPQLIQIERNLRPEDFRATEIIYPLAQEICRSGIYAPNRSSMLCSRKSCSYWRWCEQSFGGTVSGGEDE